MPLKFIINSTVRQTMISIDLASFDNITEERLFLIMKYFTVDGFMPGEQYPQVYNDLKQTAISNGLIKETGCPEKLF